MRPGIEVRSIRLEDMDGLVALCMTARRETWTGPQVCSSDPDTVGHQLGALSGLPGGSVLVALSDESVVGLLLGRVVGPSLFTDEVSFAVEAVYVDPRHRRRGAGHALMLVAVELAITAGAELFFAAPIPGARGMQRFFVRLGFSPAAAHRVTSTAALHRRLAADAARRRPGARSREELIARRRQTRAETGSIPVIVDQDSWRGSMSMHVNRAVQTRRAVSSTTTIS